MSLTLGVAVGVSVQCKCEGFVVGQNMKMSAFQEMAKMFDCEVHSQQLPVEGTVASLSRCHLPGKERDGVPSTIGILL